MITRVQSTSIEKRRKEKESLNLNNAQLQHTATNHSILHTQTCEEIHPLLKFPSWHAVRGHCFLHCLLSTRISNIIIFLSSYTHIFPNDFLVFTWMLWDTLTLREKVYVHLSIYQSGHLLIRLKETPAVWKQAVQLLIIRLCREIRPRSCCIRAYCRVRWKIQSHSTSPSDTWGKGLACHLSVMLRARGQGSPPPCVSLKGYTKHTQRTWKGREKLIVYGPSRRPCSAIASGMEEKASWGTMCPRQSQLAIYFFSFSRKAVGEI